MNHLIDAARNIPAAQAARTLTVSRITLPAPGRPLPLPLRVTAPAEGNDLPIVLLSHGGGEALYIPSKDGYDPLVTFYAERGFAVIQPSHLSSRMDGLGLDPSAQGFPIFGQSRIDDMTLILDGLAEIEEQIPALAGRLDHTNIAAVGHSGGTNTVGMLLGARLKNADGTETDALEPRIKAGVLLAPSGNGGDSLTDAVRANFPEMNLDFSHMTTPTLVVYGDADHSPKLTVRGAEWHTDAYRYGPGGGYLLTLLGGAHFLGGVAGYDLDETDDADPDRLAITQRMTCAYLRSALLDEDAAWPEAMKALAEHAPAHGRVDAKKQATAAPSRP
ncbi:alpha/beta hydrolase family protein [Streptomyces sp. NPDC056296]|uniref:alpha/beta hydrolase family protein n=1 Tax=Streptomyces sp. NPDC056296 TaxID=3345775 RepID=UPI0035E021F4